MKRSITTVAAVALTAVVSVGATSPAAAAGGKANGPAKGGVSKAKIVKADKRLLVAKRAVSALIARKEAALQTASERLTASGIAETALVQANIDRDLLHLAALKVLADAATEVSAVRAVDAKVRQVRPEIYAVLVNGLRQAAAFQGLAAANQTLAADLEAHATVKESEGFDVTLVRELLASATAANDQVAPLATAAAEKGIALTALSSHDERGAFSADIAAAGDLLDQVAADLQAATDALAAMVPVIDPVTAQPVEQPVA